MPRFMNSIVIAFGSTFLAVFLGVLAAYGFSRFKVPLADDLLFFILSTRMMPPIAVAIPIYLMYREVGLSDTALGMILLYTAVNVSLAVWLLKGFIDEIPREYEEAAMIDGYTRLAGIPEDSAAAGNDRHRGHRHILHDLFVERVCLRIPAHFRQRADGATFHPYHHRRGWAGLARRRGGHNDLPDSHSGFHYPPAQASVARHHLRSGPQMSSSMIARRRRWPRWLRRGRLESLATAVIGAGFLMLFQPFSLTLYTWSFVTMLVGTAMFIVVSKFPE